MTFKIYYKKFIDGVNKPVICHKNDNYHVADFTVLKDDTPRGFNPESPKILERVKESMLKSNGGEILDYRDHYVGENTITWHFAKSAVDNGVIEF